MRNVLITTKYRGVFAGQIEDDQDINAKTMPLKKAKMAIKWGTKRGMMELAKTGPTEDSLISEEADIPSLHGITAVFDITEESWDRWLKT